MKINLPPKGRFRVAPFVISLVYTLLGPVCLSLLLPSVRFSPWLPPLALVLMTIASLFISTTREHTLSSLRYTEIEDLMHASAGRANADLRAFRRELLPDVVFWWVWLAAAFLFACLSVFAGLRYVVPAVFGYVYLWGLVNFIIPPRKRAPSQEDVLPRGEFPRLYAVADKVFGPRAQAKIINAKGAGFGAVTINGQVCILLDAFQYSILSDAELEAILRSEAFYHVAERHSLPRCAERLNDCRPAAMSCRVLVPADMLMQYPMTRVVRAHSMYEFASGAAETRAMLRYIAAAGSGAPYLTALAKCRMLSFFDTFEPNLHVNYLESEAPSEDVLDRELALFRGLFRKRKALWSDLLRKELPAWGGTDLSYSEICSALSLPFPDISLDPGLEGDRPAVEAWYSRLYTANITPGYAEKRRTNYLEPMDILNRYYTETASGKEYTALEMRPVLDACAAVSDSEALIELCDRCIASAKNTDEAAHAHFLLGRELLHRYDVSGFEDVLLAMENNENYVREGGVLVERLVNLFGLAEERPAYMDRIRSITQLAADRNTLAPAPISPLDELTADSVLPAKLADENLRFMLAACGEHLEKVWVMDRPLSDTFTSIVYVLRFAADTPAEEKQAALEQIYDYLDSLSHYYFLYEPDQLNGVDPDKISDACIWRKD